MEIKHSSKAQFWTWLKRQVSLKIYRFEIFPDFKNKMLSHRHILKMINEKLQRFIKILIRLSRLQTGASSCFTLNGKGLDTRHGAIK